MVNWIVSTSVTFILTTAWQQRWQSCHPIHILRDRSQLLSDHYNPFALQHEKQGRYLSEQAHQTVIERLRRTPKHTTDEAFHYVSNLFLDGSREAWLLKCYLRILLSDMMKLRLQRHWSISKSPSDGFVIWLVSLLYWFSMPKVITGRRSLTELDILYRRENRFLKGNLFFCLCRIHVWTEGFNLFLWLSANKVFCLDVKAAEIVLLLFWSDRGTYRSSNVSLCLKWN